MTLSFWQRAAREAPLTCDVAVVGGGILGCSVAYWLRRLRPELRVLIVEGRMLGSGASGRNAGFILQGTAANYQSDRETYGVERARRLWRFTAENRTLIERELDGQDYGLEPSGSLTVAGSEAEDERLQASAHHLQADGFSASYLSAEEINRCLSAKGFEGALHVPTGAMMNPLALVQSIAAESGARVLEHHAVEALKARGDRVVLETPWRAIEAGQVVLAVGSGLPKLYPELEPYARPVRAQMLATEPASERWLEVPAYTHEGYFYIRQAPSGAVLAGGARHLHEVEERGHEDATTSALQADLESYLRRHFPKARGLAITSRWSGTMSFSPDGLPVIGAVPELPGSLWVAGCTGHGMGYGFRLGRLLAEHLLDKGPADGFDLFTVERFEGSAWQALG